MKNLAKQLKNVELSTYGVYLQHERIKCHFKLSNFVGMIPLAKQMYSDACTLGSIAWQVNALMTAVISESRLGDVTNCMKTLELIVPLSRTLGNKNVTRFLIKVRLKKKNPSNASFDIFPQQDFQNRRYMFNRQQYNNQQYNVFDNNGGTTVIAIRADHLNAFTTIKQ